MERTKLLTTWLRRWSTTGNPQTRWIFCPTFRLASLYIYNMSHTKNVYSVDRKIKECNVRRGEKTQTFPLINQYIYLIDYWHSRWNTNYSAIFLSYQSTTIRYSTMFFSSTALICLENVGNALFFHSKQNCSTVFA